MILVSESPPKVDEPLSINLKVSETGTIIHRPVEYPFKMKCLYPLPGQENFPEHLKIGI